MNYNSLILLIVFTQLSVLSFGQSEDTQEEIFRVVEEMPRFPGCEKIEGTHKEKEQCAKDKMLDYIYAEHRYPTEAKEEGVEGMAVVQFKIWKDGTIRDIKVVRDPGAGTGEEAARIVSTMNDLDQKWRPGHQKGKPVCVQYTLPIKFKLEDKKHTKKHTYGYNDPVHITDVHEDPIFPDCEGEEGYDCTTVKLQEFIKENQLYPDAALKNKTEGVAIIAFVIERDGSISSITPVNKLTDGLSEDAMEIIEWMNSEGMRWTPGKVNYRDVRTRYYVEVKYDIEEWLSRK